MSVTRGEQTAETEATIRRLAEQCLDELHMSSWSKGSLRDRIDRLRATLVRVKDGPLTVDLAHQCHAEVRDEIVYMATEIGCINCEAGELYNELSNYIGTDRSTQPWAG
jgi:hypothetical protein